MAKTTAAKKNEPREEPKKNAAKGIWALSLEEKISYGTIAALSLLIIYIRSNFFEIGFERDEGAYSYYGKLLLEGKTPYIDFYEQKFPGMFYFFAMIVGIFGDTVRGMHQGFMWVNILSMLFLFVATRRLFSPYAGVIAALTFTFVSLNPYLSGYTVQGEHAVAFFISLGLLFYSYTVSHGKKRYYLLMGLAMGCAFMTKTSGMFLALWGGIITIGDFFFNRRGRPLKALWINGLIYSAGVLAIIGLMFSLIAMKGSFKEMIFWTYEIPKNYVGKISWDEKDPSQPTGNVGKVFLKNAYNTIVAGKTKMQNGQYYYFKYSNYAIFWYHALLGLLIIVFKNVSLRTRFMALSLLFFSCLTIVPGYYFYGHYWIQIIPGLAVLAGVTYYLITDVIKKLFKIKWSALPLVYVIAFMVMSLYHVSTQKDYYMNPNYDYILRIVYGSNPFPESVEIAKWLNANTKKEDGLVVMGSEPQIYFYTQKKCPSRHAYFAAIVDNVPQHKEWQREFVADVEKAKPKYFVFFDHGISLFVQPNTDKYIFEWYDKYIRANYRMVGLVDMVDGYSSVYKWGAEVNTYQPKAQNKAYVFERIN